MDRWRGRVRGRERRARRRRRAREARAPHLVARRVRRVERLVELVHGEQVLRTHGAPRRGLLRGVAAGGRRRALARHLGGGARAVAAGARAHLEERCVRHVLLVRRPHQQDYGGQPKQHLSSGLVESCQAVSRAADRDSRLLRAKGPVGFLNPLSPSSGPLKKEAETDVGPEGLSHQRRRDFWFERAR